MSTRLVLLLASVSLLVLLSSVAQVEAKTFIVGGSMTWNPWSTRTRKWKGPNKVRKGDTLVFKWRQKSNVIAQEDGMNPFAAYFYYKCSWDTADLTLHTVVSEPKSSGSVKFTIPKDAVGMHYFFYSNVGNSCKKGQKYETPIIF